MRIITGKFRGRNLFKSDHLKSLRPTTDKNREALFNILSFGKFDKGLAKGLAKGLDFKLIDSKILDLCCGSGSIGFEALSRGAKFITFIDNNREHLELVKKNAELLKVESDSEIICADARNLLANKNEFDLIFLDPPYSEDSLPIIKNLLEKNFIHEKTLLVVEMKSGKEPKSFSPLTLLESRKYGSTSFNFLRK
jgi:16S rRNA (guanine966-N2)-methyltransferase